jgi:hypothetical protein
MPVVPLEYICKNTRVPVFGKGWFFQFKTRHGEKPGFE